MSQATARVSQSATAGDAAPDEVDATDEGSPDRFGAMGDSPIEVREKVHSSPPMSLEQALHMMELVGHDFYLFHDSETDRPSVVYRRRGWSYGVLHLETEGRDAEEDMSAAS